MPVSARNIDIDELKAVLDPESVLEFIGYEHSSPKTSGAEIRDYCPILGCRQERKKGSVGALLINANTHVFYCHKCSAKGSLIDLYMQAIGCSFQEARQQLGDRFLFNSNLPRKATPRPLLKKETVVIDPPPVNNHPLWINAKEDGDPPYLRRKKVSTCAGLRYGPDESDYKNESIIVPFFTVDGILQTLQFINDYGKFFLKDHSYKGAFFPTGEIKDGEEIYVAEGLATCLTIHEALEGAVTVISAGSAGNIPAVVEAIKGKYPNVKIKLALDANEAARKNIEKIAELMIPFTYTEPNFEGLQNPDEGECADFNDLVSKCGLSVDAVRKQLIENEKRKEVEMTTTIEKTYLLLQSKKGKSFEPLKDRFNELGAFYTGIGYAFPQEKETLLRQLVEKLPEISIHILPLEDNQTFESFRLSNKASFKIMKQFEADQKLLELCHSLKIEDPSEESVSASSSLSQSQKDSVIALLHKKEKLTKSIEWARGMEAASQVKVAPELSFRTISEISKTYFTVRPQDKPRLLYRVEKDGEKTAFLHKEIVAIIVGEGGRGKTHLLALLSMSIASGIPFLQVLEVEMAGAVVFAVGENNHNDIHILLFKIYGHVKKLLEDNVKKSENERFMLHHQNPLGLIEKNLIPFTVYAANAHFIDKNGLHTSYFETFLSGLKEKEKEFEGGIQLIVLDPAARFSGPETEKDNAVATSFMSCLELLSQELIGRPTIMLAHHKSKAALKEGKTSQSDGRGSSALTDGCRAQFNLSMGQSQEYSIFEVTKTNFTAYPPKIILKKDKDGIPEFQRFDSGKTDDKKNDEPIVETKGDF